MKNNLLNIIFIVLLSFIAGSLTSVVTHVRGIESYITATNRQCVDFTKQ